MRQLNHFLQNRIIFLPLLQVKLSLSKDSFQSIFKPIDVGRLVTFILFVISYSQYSLQELSVIQRILSVQSISEWCLNTVNFHHALNRS